MGSAYPFFVTYLIYFAIVIRVAKFSTMLDSCRPFCPRKFFPPQKGDNMRLGQVLLILTHLVQPNQQCMCVCNWIYIFSIYIINFFLYKSYFFTYSITIPKHLLSFSPTYHSSSSSSLYHQRLNHLITDDKIPLICSIPYFMHAHISRCA